MNPALKEYILTWLTVLILTLLSVQSVKAVEISNDEINQVITEQNETHVVIVSNLSEKVEGQ